MFSDETESGDVKTSSQYLSDVPTSAMDGRDHTGTTPPRHSATLVALTVVEECGFGPLFVHQTGHGLGFRYHEPLPLLHPDNEKRIEPGMVSSVASHQRCRMPPTMMARTLDTCSCDDSSSSSGKNR